jgi:hypothetical protein
MLRQLIAWDAAGNVVATLDHVVAKDEEGKVVGLLDFEAHELAGGRLREIAEVSNAVGSGTWPEWLGSRAHLFRVELDPSPVGQRAKITALVHKESGHRRVRADIEAAIAERINEERAKGHAKADIRDIVGGPQRPLLLDEDGRTKAREKVSRPALPFVAVGKRPR